jgi:Arc/MetJ family transcription regulator
MVLPILVALHSSEFDLITMEQPELHIHPRQQAELGDELIAATLRAEKSKQLIIETHSEHLILRILRRIRETTEEELAEWPESLRIACPNGISPDDVAVLYVKPGSEDSSEGSTIIQMPITPDGDFGRPWPGGFFAERSKELF